MHILFYSCINIISAIRKHDNNEDWATSGFGLAFEAYIA